MADTNTPAGAFVGKATQPEILSLSAGLPPLLR